MDAQEAIGERKDVRSALEELYRKRRDRLFALALALLGDANAAEDVLQEAFTKTLHSLHRYQERGKMFNYIVRLLYTTAIDRLRKKKELPLDAELSTDSEPDCEEETSILNTIRSLAPEQRDVIILRHYSGLSFREISELLGLPLGTVLSRMRYGLLRLKNLLERRV